MSFSEKQRWKKTKKQLNCRKFQENCSVIYCGVSWEMVQETKTFFLEKIQKCNTYCKIEFRSHVSQTIALKYVERFHLLSNVYRLFKDFSSLLEYKSDL